jgi:PAS domain S-box-containing protein
MKKSEATREELLVRVRDLEQRLVEANSTIEALRSRTGADAGESAASPQAKVPGLQLAAELDTANEELQIQTAELQLQNEDLQAQAEELEMQQDELERLYEKLEAERSLLHTVLEQMPAGVVIAEASSGKFLLVNRQMEAILGRPVPPSDRLEDYTHFQGFHPDALPFGHGDYPLARALTIGQNTLDEEVHTNRGDSSPAIIQENAAPVRNRRGEIVAAVSTYRDVTVRKQRERQILRFASFLQLNPSPVLEVDRTGQVIYYNAAALDAVRDLGGQAAISIFVPADLDKILLAFEESGQTIFERQVTISDTVYLVNIFFAEQFDTFRLYTIDITERQRAEEAVWRAKEDWERTFNAVPDLIAILDNDYRLVRVNRAMAQALGEGPEDLAGKFCYEVMHRSGQPHRLCPHRLLLKDGQEHTAELQEMDLDLLVTVAPIHDETGKILGSVHVARNITARKRAEKALQRLNEELEQRVESRTEELVESVAQLEEEITDRQQAEQNLDAERKRLYAVLESIPAHVFLLRPDHTLAFANGEFVRRFGKPDEKRCYEIVGLATPCSECQAMAVFQTGAPNVREWPSPEGQVYQIYDYPFTDLDGSPLVLEMGIDITAAKEAERQVQSSGRLYRLLSRVNEAIVRAQEPEGLFREACRIMMEEGDFLLCWIGRVDRQAGVVRAAAQYGLKEGYPNDITISLKDVPEGRGPTGVAVREARLDVCQDIAGDSRMEPWRERQLARGFHSSAAFPLFVGGQVEGVLTLYSGQKGFFNPEEVELLNSLAQDLSFAMEAMDREAKRRQAEEEIHRLNGELEELVNELRKQANLLDLAQDAILVRDLDSRIIYWNHGAQETYGWRPDEVLGRVAHILLQTKFPLPPEEIDQTLIRQGQWYGELVHTRADGSVITVASRQVLQTDEEDNPVAVLEVNRDITERKRAEEALLRTHDELAETVAQLEEEMNDRQRAELELAKLNAELEQRVKERTAQLEAANREMEAFTYSVSHDLKAPIRAIDGFSRILMQEHVASLDAEGLRLLEVVRHNTGFMAQLIEDLLALSRLGRREIRKARLDLAQMAATAFQRLKEEYPDRPLDLSIQDLPAAFGDPSLIHQVLANLLSNACKFTKFKENAAIEVGGWSEGGENVYYVKDNGVGFDMRYVNKLFGVFQRLHKVSDFEGTGVGLALVQRIILRHGGRVWAEGHLDAGATFFFALPEA